MTGVQTCALPICYPALEKFIVTDDGDIKNDTAAAGDEIKFKLESTVPEDLLNYLNPDPVDPPEINGEPQGDATEGDVPEGRGEYHLTFHDQMDDGLSLAESPNFTVTIDREGIENDRTVTLNADQIQYNQPHEEDGSTCDFEITLDLVELYEAGIITDEDITNTTPIIVTYTGKLDDTVTNGTFHNTSWVSYPTDDSEKDTVTVDTYQIKVFKYDQDKDIKDPEAALSDAEFSLYAADQVNEDGQLIEGAVALKTGISNEDGFAFFNGLDAGTYYLKETKAPDNYVCSEELLEIVIPGENADENNIVSVSFANSLIPHTGGMGTTLFSIVGGVLIAMAGTIFVISRRKRRA